MRKQVRVYGSIFSLLGITSGFGAISNGNNPTQSFIMAGFGLLTILLTIKTAK